jgi:hypothetical protein
VLEFTRPLSHNYGMYVQVGAQKRLHPHSSRNAKLATHTQLVREAFSHLRVVDAAGDGLGPRAVVAAGRSRGGQPLANHEARVARHLDVVARLVVELEGRNATVLRVAWVWASWLA